MDNLSNHQLLPLLKSWRKSFRLRRFYIYLLRFLLLSLTLEDFFSQTDEPIVEDVKDDEDDDDDDDEEEDDDAQGGLILPSFLANLRVLFVINHYLSFQIVFFRNVIWVRSHIRSFGYLKSITFQDWLHSYVEMVDLICFC